MAAKKKIEQPIVDYKVRREDEETPAEESRGAEQAAPEHGESAARDEGRTEPHGAEDNVIHMHERVERPDKLVGSTYKIKPPMEDHALYITINDIVLNEGTDHEHRRPFEIFINSKNMDQFQWIVALTRIVSAVFRKGGDVTFLTEELKAVFDPRGGYWRPGGKYMPSIVAEIGDVIERHLKEIGMIREPGPDPYQMELIEQKKAEYQARQNGADGQSGGEPGADADNPFPAGAVLCQKCSTKAMVMMDGCLTCLNCGESKCG